MPLPLAERILKVAEEGLNLWKTFIATRQEAYNRKQDKEQIKAIECGEKGFFAMDELLAKLGDEYDQDRKKILRWKKKFFKHH
jgi:hypothetical protein